MTESKSILLIDDDKLLSPFVVEYLEAKSFKMTYAKDGLQGWETFKKGLFDLLILDVKMPYQDGFALAKRIREENPVIPIIFVTGEGEKEDRIHGLSIGADDYLVKPFSMEELYLRINNLLRRAGNSRNSNTPKLYKIGAYSFNSDLRELMIKNKVKRLTTIESRLLLHFLQSPNMTINKETAMRTVWDDDHAIRERSLTVYVSKLRHYLDEDSTVSIFNVHGQGYQLVINSKPD